MKPSPWQWGVVAAVGLLAGYALTVGNPTPGDPHEPLNAVAACPDCHRMASSGKVVPSSFTSSVSELCLACHDKSQLGRSHPVDMVPRMPIRGDLPLDDQGRMTCGTCHNPHARWVFTKPLRRDQEPAYSEGGTEWYKTLYLRLINYDAKTSTSRLCLQCHDY